MVLSLVCISFSAIFIRLSSAPAAALAFYRLALTVVLFLPAWPRRSHPFAAVPTSWRWAAVAAGCLLGLHFLTWIASLGMTSVASSVVLVSTHPLWVAAWSALVWHERIGWRGILGIAAALGGTAVLAIGDGLGGLSLTGDLLALVGAASFAGYLLVGRQLRSRVAVLPYSTVVYAIAAAALLPAALVLHSSLWPYPARQWLFFFALALVPTVGGHTVFNWALEYLPATVVSVALLWEPVGASLLAWWMLVQPPSAADVAGGVLVLAGIAVYGWPSKGAPEPAT
ncbi:MAG TPA: DMT family transporter [Bacillota bacterium]|nr:DMT family transporter [Bacillota bacterium]